MTTQAIQAGRRRTQRGFTLVELAIVLVVIGLILGGIVGAQALINNARVNNAKAEMDRLQAAFVSYTGTYNVLPGDDNAATGRFPAAGFTVSNTTGNSAGDGILSGTSPFSAPGNAIATTTEQQMVWHHLRAAKLVENNTPNYGQLAGPFGTSVFGFQNNALNLDTGVSVCLSAVPQAQAVQIDQQFDDGIANAGSIRATQATGGRPNTNVDTQAPANDYTAGGTYIVCRLLG